MHFLRPTHFERRHEPLAPRAVFLRRLARSALVALGLLLFSLALGMVGYRCIVKEKSWVDALYSASMLLGGMGPAETPDTIPGKVFASFYALYSGLIFLVAVAVVIAPLLHRLMHRFHLEAGPDGD